MTLRVTYDNANVRYRSAASNLYTAGNEMLKKQLAYHTT